MKYIILSDSDNVEPFAMPRQLYTINKEVIISRTIKLLKETGVKDVILTSHDTRFDNLGAIRYEPKSNNYVAKEHKGYWLDAFPIELLNEPVTFLLGDVYYSDEAIKTIVNTETKSHLFFCTYKNKDIRYAKHHDEPLAYKVIDTETFKEHIDKVKTMYDKKLTNRQPIMWELYRSLNGLDVNRHTMSNNYIAINDYTCDVDNVEDIKLIENRLKIKSSWTIRATQNYCDYSPNITAVQNRNCKPMKDAKGKNYFKINKGDLLIVPDVRGEYLVSERKLAEIIEIIPCV